MRTYKRFLYTKTPMSRSTYYRYRKRLREAQNTGAETVILCDDFIRGDSAAIAPEEMETGSLTNNIQVDWEEHSNECEGVDDVLLESQLNPSKDNKKSFLDIHSSPSKLTLQDTNKSTLQRKKLCGDTQAFSKGKGVCSQSHQDKGMYVELSSSDDDGLADADDSSIGSLKDDSLTQDLIFTEKFSQDDVNRDEQKYEQLCPCTTKTAGDVMLMCLALGIRHSLTWDSQLDIFKMINCIFGRTVIRPTKFSYFKTLGLEAHKKNVSYHVYCPECEAIIDCNGQNKNAIQLCSECNFSVNVSNPLSYFATVPIEHQICRILEDPTLANLMVSYRFNRMKSDPDCIEDVYDGKAYKKLCENNGPLSSPLNFSYSFFTDGVQFSKSSSRTMWPIYLTLQELPPKLRNQHIILAALYVGPKDPNQIMFLEPFVNNANKLATEGFSWIYKKEQVTSKLFPLFLVADSVARYQILNRQSFIGKYGCTFCYQKTKRTRTGNRFAFELNDDKPEERTKESLKQDIELAYERQNLSKLKRHYKGVKGPSALMFLAYFCCIVGIVVDYMHCLLLNRIKTHMDLLFDSKRKKFWIGMSEERVGLDHLFSAIDDRLLNIKPPSSVSRRPRSITNYKIWKASEWRSWLLFYAVPCLDGLLKPKYLSHIAMLSVATNLLLQKSIHPDEISYAHELYMKYTYFCQDYFGDEEMVYSVHLLSHIKTGVLNWGPLWTHSAFPYEGQNHYLLKLCKGATSIVKQIVQRFMVYSSLPKLCHTIASSIEATDFCEEILERKLKYFVRCSECILLGKGDLADFTNEERRCVEQNHVEINKILIYKRFLYNNMRLTCSHYCKGKKNCDSFIFISLFGVLKLVNIIHILKCGNSVRLIVRVVEMDKKSIFCNQSVTVKHLRRVSGLGPLMLVAPEQVRNQCIIMNLPTGDFVTKLPYGCYKD